MLHTHAFDAAPTWVRGGIARPIPKGERMSTPGEMPNPLDPNEKGRDPNDPEKRADRSDTGGSTGGHDQGGTGASGGKLDDDGDDEEPDDEGSPA